MEHDISPMRMENCVQSLHESIKQNNEHKKFIYYISVHNKIGNYRSCYGNQLLII